MIEHIVFCDIRDKTLEGRSTTTLRFLRSSYSSKRSAFHEVQGHKDIGQLECRSAECNTGS